MKLTHRSTMIACYNGYITQAICINLAPLLYLTFQRQFSLTLSQISTLIAFNFFSQLTIDLLASRYANRMNLRLFTVLAHLLTVVGLLGLPFFTIILPPYVGLVISVTLLGVGGGFTEVLISPLLEACPTDGKSGNMSLLHSFYCWGQAGVVLFSGLFFHFFEIDQSWRFLPVVWSLIPLLGAIAFCVVPIYRLPEAEGESGSPLQRLLRQPIFFCFLLMMLCAGAGEMVMSQWASGFAESALQIPKELGDLLGPGAFALMMGIARLLYGKFSNYVNLRHWMMAGCVLCALSYLIAAFAPIPALSLIGCALCGFSVGVFWPGILSQASEALPTGGMVMFAVLALFGDIGCLAGPSMAGGIADALGGNLRFAFCFATVFPLLCLVALIILSKQRKKKER